MKNENPFKSKLYTHTVPVREEVWEAVEKRLPPKSDERSFLFWFMLFASTLISGALMFGIINNKKSNSTPILVPHPPYTYTTPASPETSQTPNPGSNAINQNSIATNSETAESASSNLSQSSLSSDTNQSSLSSNADRTSNSKTSNSTQDISKTHPSTRNQQGQNNSNHNSKTTNPVDLNQAFNNSKKAESTSAAHPSSTSAAATASQFTGSINATQTHRTTTPLPLADVEALYKQGDDVIGTRNFKPDPNCYKFSGITGTYYLSVDAFAGPGFSPRSFTAADSESSSYSMARETTESNQYAWSAGARFNFHLQRGWALRLGILYDQAGDVFDFTDTLATHSTFRIDSFFSADGFFLYSDSSRVLIFGTLIKKIHNTYRHVDVPLLASFEMPIGRSSLMFNVGPVFNLSSSYEGQILDPMLHPRTITPGSQNELYAYKTSLGVSLYFGAGLVFPLTDNISGLVEPRYLYRLNPVTIQSYPLEEHRHFAGLNLGLRYYLK